MAVHASTKPETYGEVPQGSAWLSAGETGVPTGAGSTSEAPGLNDACVAAFMFNVECNDSYVGAFLLNLRKGGRD